jgi:hypothetical protein
LYYYHDQHSLHNNNDALQSEHEQYTAACTAQHTNTANKSPQSQNSFPHTTFHNLKKSNHAANTLATLNPSEFEAKASKSFAKKYGNGKSSRHKGKFYGEHDDTDVPNEGDDEVDINKLHSDFCDNDMLTSHYYLQNDHKLNHDRRGKKAKR